MFICITSLPLLLLLLLLFFVLAVLRLLFIPFGFFSFFLYIIHIFLFAIFSFLFFSCLHFFRKQKKNGAPLLMIRRFEEDGRDGRRKRKPPAENEFGMAKKTKKIDRKNERERRKICLVGLRRHHFSLGREISQKHFDSTTYKMNEGKATFRNKTKKKKQNIKE